MRFSLSWKAPVLQSQFHFSLIHSSTMRPFLAVENVHTRRNIWDDKKGRSKVDDRNKRGPKCGGSGLDEELVNSASFWAARPNILLALCARPTLQILSHPSGNWMLPQTASMSFPYKRRRRKHKKTKWRWRETHFEMNGTRSYFRIKPPSHFLHNRFEHIISCGRWKKQVVKTKSDLIVEVGQMTKQNQVNIRNSGRSSTTGGH